MDRLPSNIMFHIFSRVPGKCLARSRCVSKEWGEYIDDPYLMIVHDERVLEPIPILYHSRLSLDRRIHSVCFHTIESKQLMLPYDTDRITYDLEPKEGRLLKFLRKKPLSESSLVRIRVRGSCIGLICLSQDEDYNAITSLVVVHPLRKECYELPPLPMSFDSSKRRGSCGLGFDASTNSLKMVCVSDKYFVPARTLVHVFGTNSWREIPQVPSYPIEGEAIFYNCCLHWLVSHIHVELNNKYGGRGVIWFDVNKEEFGLIDPPKRIWSIHSCADCQLVDLNGEVGYVCHTTMEVWVLKQKEWVTHCQFKEYPVGCDVLGCWNKDGDLLVRQESTGDSFFIYNLKSGVRHRTNIVVPDNGRSPNISMHPNKLSSIRGIGTNSFSMKKTDLKESFQRLLSCY